MADLYALPPEEFTAARDAAAKQARADGDRARARALSGLRRPTVAAHLVNLLVRAEPELLQQLRDLGAALAQAQAQRQGDELRALGEQRRALVAAVADRAVSVGGREVAAAVRGEVEATLEAALADPAAGEAVASGRLVRALSFAGFGGVELDDAVAADTGTAAPVDGPREAAPEAAPAAVPDDAPAPPPATARARRAPRPTAAQRKASEALRRAEQAALDGAGRLDDAVRAADAALRAAQQRTAEAEHARAAVLSAQQVRDEAEAEVARLREELAAAEDRARTAAHDAREAAAALPAAERRERAAARSVEAAQDEVAEAQEAAEAARGALDGLRREQAEQAPPP